MTEVKGDLKYVEPIDEEKKPFNCKLCDMAFNAKGIVCIFKDSNADLGINCC